MSYILIETDRLLLREMSLSDMEALSSILQDENVMYAYNGAFSDEETLVWMQKQLQRYKDHGFGLWGMFLKGTGEMIGQCGITMQEYRGGQVPEIGYLLAHKYWHKAMLRKPQPHVVSMDLMCCVLKLCIPLSGILISPRKMSHSATA